MLCSILCLRVQKSCVNADMHTHKHTHTCGLILAASRQARNAEQNKGGALRFSVKLQSAREAKNG